MDEWDRPHQPAPRRRPVAVGALIALAVAGGLFVRAGGFDGPSGALDVERDAAGEAPPPEDPAVETPAPGDASDDRVRDSGEAREATPRDDADGGPVPDGKGRAELADDGAPDGGAETGSWEVLPDAPVPGRAGHTLAWSGEELLVWGGMARADAGARGEFFSDGAAYDPRSGHWRTLPPAPLEGRSEHGAAWTGDELLVWGGAGPTAHFSDGAAYDPVADSWRVIAPSPLSPRQRPAAVWTGDELLVLGGSDYAGTLLSAAAYSPAGDSWRPVADLPEEFTAGWNLDGAWVGEAAVVWAEHADHPAPGAWYEPSADRWTMLPSVSRRGPVAAAWTGEDLLVLRGSGLVAWRPGDDGWESRQPPWGSSEPWVNRAHWTGEHLVVVRGANQPRIDVYDPAADAWEEGPTLPGGVGYGPSAWSGTALLTWGGSEYGAPGRDASGAAFRPEDDR